MSSEMYVGYGQRRNKYKENLLTNLSRNAYAKGSRPECIANRCVDCGEWTQRVGLEDLRLKLCVECENKRRDKLNVKNKS